MPTSFPLIGPAMRMGCLLALVLVLVTACAAGPRAGQEEPDRLLVWPAPPLEPKIKWIKEIRSYKDVSVKRGFWRRLADLIVGESESHIVKPYGVYSDATERLFIVDSGWGVVHMMDMGKGLYSIIPYGGERKFQSPIGVTGDDGDNVYITDSAAGTIWRYTVGQDSVQQFTPFKLGRPTGIAYSREKHLLYVSDTTAHQIIVFDLSGRERFRFGTRGSGPRQFNFPTDLFVDRLGRVFVTDPLNHRIQFFSPEGDYLGAIGQPGDAAGYLSKPKGVAVDSEGHIYVCDALQDAVQIFDENGQVLLSFGEQGDAPGEFWMPSGIYIDRDDTIYVSDTYNQRIQVFKYLKSQGAGWDTKGTASRTGTSPDPGNDFEDSRRVLR